MMICTQSRQVKGIPRITIRSPHCQACIDIARLGFQSPLAIYIESAFADDVRLARLECICAKLRHDGMPKPEIALSARTKRGDFLPKVAMRRISSPELKCHAIVDVAVANLVLAMWRHRINIFSVCAGGRRSSMKGDVDEGFIEFAAKADLIKMLVLFSEIQDHIYRVDFVRPRVMHTIARDHWLIPDKTPSRRYRIVFHPDSILAMTAIVKTPSM